MSSFLMTLDVMVPSMKTEAGNRTYGMFGGSSIDQLTMAPQRLREAQLLSGF